MDKAIDIIDYMRSLPDEMKTEAVCWHALRQTWYALRHIPHDLQTKEMQIYALKRIRPANTPSWPRRQRR